MMLKTSKLSGAMLDFYATLADGVPREDLRIQQSRYTGQLVCVLRRVQHFSPSTSWCDGGPLHGRMLGRGFGIYKVMTDIEHIGQYCCYPQGIQQYRNLGYGDTPLIAVCRALVLNVLGEEVEEVEVTN